MNLTIDFQKWLAKINGGQIPPPDIKAFNFGLFETADGYTIYLTGSKTYDPDDSDWACEADFEPAPGDKYLLLTKGLTQNMEWDTVLEEVKKAITEYVNSDKFQDSILNGQIITTGFDDGDLIKIN